MTLKIGDRIPAVTLTKMSDAGPTAVETAALFAGRTVVLFAVPGAFTPTCSEKHLPGFVDKAAEILAKGVDEIVCVAANDAFVMNAWGKAAGAIGKISMLADGNGEFAKATGLTIDLSKLGLGTRLQRFSMLVKDGKVVQLNIEEPGAVRLSSAEHLLTQLG